MKKQNKKWLVWNLLDSVEGDKVVWIILLMLVLISVVCMFSSTSRLATHGITRVDIVRGQLVIVAIGMGIVLLCYNIRKIEFFQKLSFWLLPLSILLLVLVRVLPGKGSPLQHIIMAPVLNGAKRTLVVMGKQIHVLEIVKVSMVLYLAWALDALKQNKLKRPKGDLARKVVYIYLPFLSVLLLALPSSNTAALFIGGIMFLVILLGGGSKRDLAVIVGAGALVLTLCFGIYKVSDGKVFQRIGTGISRVFDHTDWEKQFKENERNSTAWIRARDHLHQGYSAKIAIHEGGITGKGPGQSTQRYIVPVMPSDYMYSFIVEEYGIWGGMLVLALYVSLMARGAIIVRDSGEKLYPKLVVAGLCLLIVGQAYLHMLVNVDIGPMTGQTLPLISHGNSAFICFSIAFGIILSFSRKARRKIETETAKAAPLAGSDDFNDDEL